MLRPCAAGPDRDAGGCPLRYEIVIDGLTLEALERATAAGLHRAAMAHQDSLSLITSGNYGGKLGPFHIRLHDVLERYAQDESPEAGGG